MERSSFGVLWRSRWGQSKPDVLKMFGQSGALLEALSTTSNAVKTYSCGPFFYVAEWSCSRYSRLSGCLDPELTENLLPAGGAVQTRRNGRIPTLCMKTQPETGFPPREHASLILQKAEDGHHLQVSNTGTFGFGAHARLTLPVFRNQKDVQHAPKSGQSLGFMTVS